MDPEEKRERIGNVFGAVQQRVLARMGLTPHEWLLGQGTIYPDTIESAGTEHADRIKTHHNRVDVIVEMMQRGLVIEPLKQLYKDEVRVAGDGCLASAAQARQECALRRHFSRGTRHLDLSDNG